MERYLRLGTTREVRRLSKQEYDLPRYAVTKVACHFLEQRSHPSSKEGNKNPLADGFGSVLQEGLNFRERWDSTTCADLHALHCGGRMCEGDHVFEVPVL